MISCPHSLLLSKFLWLRNQPGWILTRWTGLQLRPREACCPSSLAENQRSRESPWLSSPVLHVGHILQETRASPPPATFPHFASTHRSLLAQQGREPKLSHPLPHLRRDSYTQRGILQRTPLSRPRSASSTFCSSSCLLLDPHPKYRAELSTAAAARQPRKGRHKDPHVLQQGRPKGHPAQRQLLSTPPHTHTHLGIA